MLQFTLPVRCTGEKLAEPEVATFNTERDRAHNLGPFLPIITSMMFGGDNLDVMYATSIGAKTLGMEPGPDGGRLFAIKGLGVKGKPEPRFAG